MFGDPTKTIMPFENKPPLKGYLGQKGYFKLDKGQLISKCLFAVFNFLQKTNKNMSHCSKIEFVCSFFGGNVSLKKSF